MKKSTFPKLFALATLLGALAFNLPAADDDQAPAKPEETPAQTQPTAAAAEKADDAKSSSSAQSDSGTTNNADNDNSDQDRDRVAVMGDTRLDKGETAKDFVVVFGKGRLDGHVEGDAVVVGGDAEIDGTIDGDLVLVLSKAHLGPHTVVKGQMNVVGPPPEIDDSARIHRTGANVNLGSVRDFATEGILLARPFPPTVRWAWYVAFIFFAITFIVAILFQRPVMIAVKVLHDRPFACFFAGIGFKLLALPLYVLLACTVILIPAIPFVACLQLAATLLGKTALCVAIGTLLLGSSVEDDRQKYIGRFVLGAVLTYCLYMVPFLGLFVFLIIAPCALGAGLLSRFGMPKQKKIPTTPPGCGPATSAGPVAPFVPAPSNPTLPTPSTVAQESTPALPIVGTVLQTIVPETTEPLSTPSAPTTPTPGPGPIPSMPVSSFASPTNHGLPPHISSAAPRSIADEILHAPRATLGWRIIALAVDFGIIMFLVIGIFAEFFNFRHDGRVVLLAWFAYHVSMGVWKQTTIGGAIFGLKTLRTSGRPMDWPVAIVRSLSSAVSFLAFGLGYFWIAWDLNKQAWHDKIADTMVVKLPHAISLVSHSEPLPR